MKAIPLCPRRAAAALTLCLALIVGAWPAFAGIQWEPEAVWPDTVVLDTTSFATIGGQIAVSPGGTVFVVWGGRNGIRPQPPGVSVNKLNSLKHFMSNRKCEFLESTLGETTGDYYYLPDSLSSVYLRARHPNGAWDAIETVSITDTSFGRLTHHASPVMDVGPDGAVHVIWEEAVPNVAFGPYPHHEDGALFNLCGDAIGEFPGGDSLYTIAWHVWPSEEADSCAPPATPDSVNVAVDTCYTIDYPCYRQLGTLYRINYRKRSPTGVWGPVVTVSERSDPNDPDDARNVNTGRITVDEDGFVHVVWSQVSDAFPSCAWWPRVRGGFGAPGTGHGKAPLKRDAYYRTWDGAQDGPEGSDSVYNVTDDVIPDTLTALGADASLQSDLPLSILVTGSGLAKTVHVTLNLGPVYPDPPDGQFDRYNDALMYVCSTDGGAHWTPRTDAATWLERVIFPEEFSDTCRFAGGNFTIRTFGGLVADAQDNAHLFYTHLMFEYDSTAGCSPSNCGAVSEACFRPLGWHLFHKNLFDGDSTNWDPPSSVAPHWLSDFGGQAENCHNYLGAPALADAYGTLHAFWFDSRSSEDPKCSAAAPHFYDNVSVYHSTLGAYGWAVPDTVVTFDSDATVIAGIDVCESRGVFHMILRTTPGSVGAQQLQYFRGVLTQDVPGTIPCDSAGTVVADTTFWSGSIALCQSYTVDTCEVLVVDSATTVVMSEPGIEILVRGKIVVRGTEALPVTFRSYRTPERATVGWWKGIRLDGASARGSFTHASISGAEYGIKDEHRTADTNHTPAACAASDAALGPGRLIIDNCRFAYNGFAGVQVIGDADIQTPDLVRVTNSLFETNFKGLELKNADANGQSGYVIRNNRFLYNDQVGIEIQGKFNRAVVADSNLFQGLGADELILDLPDDNEPDVGIWYDESTDGSNGDSLRFTNNTFYRIEDSGIKLDLLSDANVAFSKTKVFVGDTTAISDNFFYRVGTGLHLNATTTNVKVRRNAFLHYGVGIWTSNRKPDLGKATAGTAGLNYFDDCNTDDTSPPFFSGFHVKGSGPWPSDSLYAHGNWWCPVVRDGGDTTMCTAATYVQSSALPIAMRQCLASDELPDGYPSALDRWGVLGMALKTERRPAVEGAQGAVPGRFRLFANQPNPFNPRTEIVFDLPSAVRKASLCIYDVQGRRVALLRDGPLPAGRYREVWEGRDSRGADVGSGIYFYRLAADTFDETRKMTLIR